MTARAIASRLHAMYMLFNPRLIGNRPTVISVIEWERLQIAELTGDLVMCEKLFDRRIILKINPLYDMYVHAVVNYGSNSNRICRNLKTRYRWWTQTNISFVKFLSMTMNNYVHRTIIFKHNCLSKIFVSPTVKSSLILPEMAEYIDRVHHLYIDDPEYKISYGRSRELISNKMDISEAINETLKGYEQV